MERALDPQLLALALGQHENLPTPENLSELLATAELGLLQRKPAFSDELLSNGWYLHAVGSSKYALRTYGVERQRAAFQVSAHIFDLYLQSQELQHIDRLKFAFASQVAYLRSQLDPNSIAIYGRIRNSLRLDLNLIENYQEIALSCGVALLGMNVDYIYRLNDTLRNEIDLWLNEWDVENIFDTPFGAAAGVAIATRHLISYLVYGRAENLDRARDLLITCIRSQPSWNDQISRWTAAHLINLADDLENSSIWTVLPPDVSPEVRRAFSMASPKILTLWPPQIQLFSENMAKGVNPLSGDVRRLFLATPTSGGKTLLAQLLIISHLSTTETSVCYVAPTRSLCREVTASLEKRLRYLEKEIVSGLPEGDWLDDLTKFDPQVEVMTPERLSFLLRSDSEKVLQKYGLFIFDEVHTLGEEGRGWTLEEDLTYLQYATEGTHHRIAFISAAIGNKIQFIEWLGINGDEVVSLSSEWRGPRRVYTIWRTEPDWQSSSEEIASKRARYAKRITYPLRGRLDTLIPHSKEFHSFQTVDPIGQLVLQVDAQGQNRTRDGSRSTAYYKMLVPLIQHLSLSGPVLVVESTVPKAIYLAKAVASEFEKVDTPVVNQLLDMVETKLGAEHSLHQVLSKGVAYHHGSLPQEVRTLIEDAVSQGQLNILVATTTMTDGVNLPVRSVVIASQGSFTKEGYEKYITGPKLINAIGRAGRAAKETEGVVVLALNEKLSPEDFKRFTPDPAEMTVTSNIATQRALESLADFENLVSENEDEIFLAPNQIISKFLSFIWYFAFEIEKRNEAINGDKINQFLGKTLAWEQLNQDNQARWSLIAQKVVSRYSATEPATRKRWASSGTSLSSAQILDGIAAEVASELEGLSQPMSLLDSIKIILDNARIDRILSLSECPRKQVFETRSGQNRQEIAIPMADLLQSWIEGEELVEISDSFFNEIADVDYRFEQVGEYISEYFENFLPWVFGTVVEWTNSMLIEKGALLALPRSIPAHIRWGVQNGTALELMFQGVVSRSLANKIGKIWEETITDGDVHSWLRSMNIDDWREQFDASVPELRNLLEFARIRHGGIAAEVIKRGTATINVQALTDDIPSSYVSLKPEDESDLSPIGIWLNGNLVARISSRDQADIASLMSTGLMVAKLEINSGKGTLDLSLISAE
jgi:replicative superfamily II helicase